MNYTNLLNDLNQATLFDLYRLYVAIGKELKNPKRLTMLKLKLRLGMELTYFYPKENRLLKAKLLELRQKNVVVRDYEQNESYIIPYHMLNLDNVDTTIYTMSSTDELTSNTVKVGDYVGFDKDGKSIVGVVRRINRQTVSLETKWGQQWRVGYNYLYRVHEAEPPNDLLPEATLD